MDYVIRTNFQGSGFVAVPNHVAQSSALSPEALGVLVYLASLPSGYTVRVASIFERFKIGKNKWQRIAREFRDCGVMPEKPEIIRGAGGRAVGRCLSVRWPEPVENTESPETDLSDRKPRKPTFGKTAKHGPEISQTRPRNRPSYKEERTKKSVGAPSVAPAPSRSPVARPMVGGSGGSVPALPDLSAFERSRVLSGQSVVVGGVLLAASSAELQSLRHALLLHSA